MTSVAIDQIGEKKLVNSILETLTVDKRLIGGFGHDSAIIDVTIKEDEFLLVNTDRSGINVAYQFGISDGKCVGDYAVSHAVSDILASGGSPFSVSIALLLPSSMEVTFVRDVMLGAEDAAKKYHSFISSGDTKDSSKFIMVVTAIGKCKKDQVLKRSGACPGDHIVVTGYLGTMVSGVIAHRKNLKLSESSMKILEHAMAFQNPPYQIAEKISKEKLAHSCTDISDGLSSAIYSLCRSSGLGAIVNKDSIPVAVPVHEVAQIIGVDSFQLALGNGDWQFLYSVPDNQLEKFINIAEENGVNATTIGKFTAEQNILLKEDNSFYEFLLIENDRFEKNRPNYFDLLSSNILYKGRIKNNVYSTI